MYFEEAIEQLKSIDWDTVGQRTNKIHKHAGYEFLRRLAYFYKELVISPKPPLASNVAMLLGYDNEILFKDYFDTHEKNESLYVNRILSYYLQLAKLCDSNNSFVKYLSIYKPLVDLLTSGGYYILRPNELEIKGVGMHPLSNWYSGFVDKPQIIIDAI